MGAYSTTRSFISPNSNHVAEQFEPFGTFEDTGNHLGLILIPRSALARTVISLARESFDSHPDSQQQCFLLLAMSLVDGQIVQVAEKSERRMP